MARSARTILMTVHHIDVTMELVLMVLTTIRAFVILGSMVRPVK